MHAAKLRSLGRFMVVKNFSWGARESHHFPQTSGLQLFFWLGEVAAPLTVVNGGAVRDSNTGRMRVRIQDPENQDV